MPARLTCVVGTKGADGVIPVRVARVDFIGRADQVARSIPEETKDPLAALNRDPAKYAGQTLKLTVQAVPMTARTASSSDLWVMFENHYRPRSLRFVMPSGMNQRIVELGLRPNQTKKVRLTVKVGEIPEAPGTPVTVTVSKIEILDSQDGHVLHTIE